MYRLIRIWIKLKKIWIRAKYHTKLVEFVKGQSNIIAWISLIIYKFEVKINFVSGWQQFGNVVFGYPGGIQTNIYK